MGRRNSILVTAIFAAIIILIALVAGIALYPGIWQLPAGDREVTISGNLTSRETGSGTTYVLALYPVVLQKIREMETEAAPYESEHVVAYTTLDAPGTYTITVPRPGEYLIYAWRDTNGDGGINHEDYQEPIGWYRTDDYLLPANVRATGGGVEGIDLELIAPTPYPEEERSVSRGSGGGTLKWMKGYPVLQLRGTVEERAYAQGYLAGPQIRDWVEYVVIEYYARSPTLYENNLLPFIRNNFSANDPYVPAVDEMIRGMQDSGTDMHIDVLDRDVTRDDIVAINSLYALMLMRDFVLHEEDTQEGGPMCSNAVVWGDLTENDELAGGVIHGKNMDGENDLRKVTVNTLLIVATEPEDGMQVAGVDWPGFYGTYNGMNEEGLILATHSSTGANPALSATDLLDYSTLYMETLLHCQNITEAETYWKSREITRTGGWNTAISEPRKIHPEGVPSVTFESDSYGMAVRMPGDIPPTGIPAILTTNNFYLYDPKTGAAAEGEPAPILPTHHRYIAMNDTLNGFIHEGRSIGTPEMIEVLQSASNSTSYSGVTEYSYIGYPDDMSFAVSREDLERKILDATYANFTKFSFEEVFR